MNRRWVQAPSPDREAVSHLQEVLGTPELLAHLIALRDIRTYEEAHRFFVPDWDALPDSFSMKGMDRAVNRVKHALQNEERILVYGDYDVDGTTAVAMLVAFLRPYAEFLDHYIPDRYAEGYGVSQKGMQYAVDHGCDVVITLDCGIRDHEPIAFAQEHGIDVIVCDHHLPGDMLPVAFAILDPYQPGCSYPFRGLSGCGIGFKFIQALRRALSLEMDEREFLDLVAVSIAADMVPVTGENRILLHHGLKRLQDAPRPGMRALFGPEGKLPRTVRDLAFGIGPKINAAGRIGHGSQAVDLLLCTDAEEAAERAAQVHTHNTERRTLDQSITEEALSQLDLEDDLNTTVVFQESWHKGVVGIVASRLLEHRYRPTVVLTQSEGWITGSARSVEGFDIHEALESCSDLLERFGGHASAAGLSFAPEHLEVFRMRFEEAVAQRIRPEQLIPEWNIDLELTIEQSTMRFLRSVQRMEPFGPGNPKPLFVAHGLQDEGSRYVGSDQSHVKFRWSQPELGSTQVNGIGFGLAEQWKKLPKKGTFSAVFSLEENTWQGVSSLQWMVLDVCPTDELPQRMPPRP